MPDTYHLPQHFFTDKIRVLILGLGGNGSEFLRSTYDIHNTLIALGHPFGLDVTCMDSDVFTESNLLRQGIWADDIGKNKAKTLVQKYNLYGGVNFKAIDRHLIVGEDDPTDFDVIISCVDSAKFRVDLCQWAEESDVNTLLFDLGNGAFTSQFILGHLSGHPSDESFKLPNIYDLFGESLLDGDKDDTPTCSAVESLKKQSLFINRLTVNHASALLMELLQTGSITKHGGFIDLNTGTVTPLMIDQIQWSVFNYNHKELQPSY